MNYGLDKYRLYYDIRVFTNNKEININDCKKHFYKKHVMPYLIEIDKNDKLKNYINDNEEHFKRFISYNHETKNKYGYIMLIYYIEMKKSFLSYILQNKKNLKPLFDYEYEYTNMVAMIDNINDLYKKGLIIYDKSMGKYRFKKNVNVDVDVKFLKDKTLNIGKIDTHRARAKLKGDTVLIEGREFKTHGSNIPSSKTLYDKRIVTYNLYDDFFNCLQYFFESINDNNDVDWKSYLKFEAIKMSKYLNDGELEKLQKEYNDKYNDELRKKNYV